MLLYPAATPNSRLAAARRFLGGTRHERAVPHEPRDLPGRDPGEPPPVRRAPGGRDRRYPIPAGARARARDRHRGDRKSTRLNSSHITISYAVFCLKKKKKKKPRINYKKKKKK